MVILSIVLFFFNVIDQTEICSLPQKAQSHESFMNLCVTISTILHFSLLGYVFLLVFWLALDYLDASFCEWAVNEH